MQPRATLLDGLEQRVGAGRRMQRQRALHLWKDEEGVFGFEGSVLRQAANLLAHEVDRQVALALVAGREDAEIGMFTPFDARFHVGAALGDDLLGESEGAATLADAGRAFEEVGRGEALLREGLLEDPEGLRLAMHFSQGQAPTPSHLRLC